MKLCPKRSVYSFLLSGLLLALPSYLQAADELLPYDFSENNPYMVEKFIAEHESKGIVLLLGEQYASDTALFSKANFDKAFKYADPNSPVILLGAKVNEDYIRSGQTHPPFKGLTQGLLEYQKDFIASEDKFNVFSFDHYKTIQPIYEILNQSELEGFALNSETLVEDVKDVQPIKTDNLFAEMPLSWNIASIKRVDITLFGGDRRQFEKLVHLLTWLKYQSKTDMKIHLKIIWDRNAYDYENASLLTVAMSQEIHELFPRVSMEVIDAKTSESLAKNQEVVNDARLEAIDFIIEDETRLRGAKGEEVKKIMGERVSHWLREFNTQYFAAQLDIRAERTLESIGKELLPLHFDIGIDKIVESALVSDSKFVEHSFDGFKGRVNLSPELLVNVFEDLRKSTLEQRKAFEETSQKMHQRLNEITLERIKALKH